MLATPPARLATGCGKPGKKCADKGIDDFKNFVDDPCFWGVVVYRGFMVGYDGGRHVRDEERGVAREIAPPRAADPKNQSRRVPWRFLATAALALVVGGIVSGYFDLWGSESLGIANKKIWDWLELVIVPTALAIGVYELNRAQQERERQAQEDRSERERKAEEAQKELELEVEKQRAQDEALQAYLDQMAQLLLDKNLRNSADDSEVRTLARARTLTVLPRLDGGRKRSIVLFLYEARLITTGASVIDLNRADLRRADFGWAYLKEANLEGVQLEHANLRSANLTNASLPYANLRRANLADANLHGANLRLVALTDANLQHVDLSYATLSGVRDVTDEELDKQAFSLEGATMSNGQRYEKWLESKGRGEDGENPEPS